MDMEGEGEEMGSWIWSEGKGIYSEQLGGKGGEMGFCIGGRE